MNKRRLSKIFIFVALIVVIVALIYLFRPSVQTPATQEAASSQSKPAAGEGAITEPPVTKGIAGATRNQVYAYYSSKNLYSALSDCIGYPSSLNMQQGTKFMLENVSQVKAAVAVKAQYFVIPAKSFQIVTATDSGFYDLVCNGINAIKMQVSPK